MACKFKSVKNCISKLSGEWTSLKVSYILPEGFNCWWSLTEPFRKSCDGNTISARQKFILTPCWLTEASPRVVTDFLSKTSQYILLLPALQKATELTLNDSSSSAVGWQSQLQTVFSPLLPQTVYFCPCTPQPLVVPGELIMELFCKLSQLKQVYVWCCPLLAWYKSKPAWSLYNESSAVFPLPPCRLGSSSIWKLTQQSKQKILGRACRFSVKPLFCIANLIFFMFEVAVC